jgi:hypothetical protein
MASQMDWTWLEVVPDSGPKIATTPDFNRWHTEQKMNPVIDPRFKCRQNIKHPVVVTLFYQNLHTFLLLFSNRCTTCTVFS